MPKNTFKQALRGSEPLAGLWASLNSPTAVEIFAHAGADWLLIDMEHGPADIASLMLQLQAASGSSTPLAVRTPSDDPVTIKRVLDAGAQTLLVPFVNDADQARRLVASTRYAPVGFRGMAGGARAGAYGRNKTYVQEADEDICVLVQIETREAVANAAAIAASGVDSLFVGPSDLSASLGYRGQPDHPDVKAAIRAVQDAAEAAGIPTGFFCATPEDAVRRFKEGFRYASVTTDSKLLVAGSDWAVAQAKAGARGSDGND